VDLFQEAALAARDASNIGLSDVVTAIGHWGRSPEEDKANLVQMMSHSLLRHEAAFEPWLLTELQSVSAEWIRVLEEDIDVIPTILYDDLPVFYRLFMPAEAEKRISILREKATYAYLAMRDYRMALHLLAQTPEPDKKLIAICYEGLGKMEEAAAEFLEAGSASDALRCYRRIPNFDKALELLGSVGDHPARQSLEWLQQMRDLAAQRPPEFQKQVYPEEKKLLEELLEASLGTARKKPAPKKAAATKTPAVKKAPAVKKKAPATAKKKPPKEWF
jgi:tetratricopeptide (TPR) repeat protein